MSVPEYIKRDIANGIIKAKIAGAHDVETVISMVLAEADFASVFTKAQVQKMMKDTVREYELLMLRKLN